MRGTFVFIPLDFFLAILLAQGSAGASEGLRWHEWVMGGER